MLSSKDKDIMKPALLIVKEALAKDDITGLELIDAIISGNYLEEIGGMSHTVRLYLESNYYNPDTQKWLIGLLVD
jgi:hypothetical protein